MNYITNVSQDRIHNQKSYPKIYPYKPNQRYLRTSAEKSLLDLYFRSKSFAELFYIISTILIADGKRKWWALLPFDYVPYYDD